MKKTRFGLLIGISMGILIWSGGSVFAQSDNGNTSNSDTVKLEIMPKSNADLGAINQEIINKSDAHVRDTYNDIANRNSDVNDQIASGIMTWDTILDYGVKLLRFLSQLGLAIAGGMILYNGYERIISVFGGESTIPKRFFGLVVIIFSYAIMRILTRAFLT